MAFNLHEYKNQTIGYGAVLKTNQALGLAQNVCLHDCFSQTTDPEVTFALFQRRIFTELPRVNWARLSRLHQKKDAISVNILASLEEDRWDMSKVRKVLVPENFNYGCVKAKAIFKGKKSVSFHVYGGGHGVRQRTIIIYHESGKYYQFYVDAVEWIGGKDKIEIGLTEQGHVSFAINQRCWDGITIERIGGVNVDDYPDGRGLTWGGIVEFSCFTAEELWRRVEQLDQLPGLQQIVITEVAMNLVPSHWEGVRQNLNAVGIGFAGVYFLGTGFEVAPPDLAQEMETCDLIPLGFFPSAGYKGKQKLPAVLRNLSVAVDLMREGDGWSFCFSTVDYEITKAQRASLTKAINSLFTEPLITRDPRERWGMLPGENK